MLKYLMIAFIGPYLILKVMEVVVPAEPAPSKNVPTLPSSMQRMKSEEEDINFFGLSSEQEKAEPASSFQATSPLPSVVEAPVVPLDDNTAFLLRLLQSKNGSSGTASAFSIQQSKVLESRDDISHSNQMSFAPPGLTKGTPSKAYGHRTADPSAQKQSRVVEVGSQPTPSFKSKSGANK